MAPDEVDGRHISSLTASRRDHGISVDALKFVVSETHRASRPGQEQREFRHRRDYSAIAIAAIRLAAIAIAAIGLAALAIAAIGLAAIAIAAIGLPAIPVAAIGVSSARYPSIHVDRIEAMTEDEFLKALEALEDVLADHGSRASLIKKRIVQIRRLRSRGASYTDIVSSNDGPLIVQLLTESSMALDTCGADVRRAEARALYAEGLTMEQIAERFGVSRQRVSTLLRKVV